MGNFILNILKFILTLFLLPLAYICVTYFVDALSAFPKDYSEFFGWGVLFFVAIFLFIYRLQPLHEFGINAISGIFKFLAPLDRFVAYIFPLYLIAACLILWLLTALKMHKFDHYLLFFGGFFAAMHEVCTSQELQEQEKSIFKPGYFFVMSVVIILNIYLVVFFFDLILKDFSFPEFFQKTIHEAKEIYSEAFEKIHKVYLTIKK